MKTFDDETDAITFMKTVNKARTRAGNNDVVVIVDGPDDNQFTVMELSEAIENNFAYRWEV